MKEMATGSLTPSAIPPIPVIRISLEIRSSTRRMSLLDRYGTLLTKETPKAIINRGNGERKGDRGGFLEKILFGYNAIYKELHPIVSYAVSKQSLNRKTSFCIYVTAVFADGLPRSLSTGKFNNFHTCKYTNANANSPYSYGYTAPSSHRYRDTQFHARTGWLSKTA